MCYLPSLSLSSCQIYIGLTGLRLLLFFCLFRLYTIGLTIAAKFTITIVTDSQKYYHDRLSIVDFTIAILSR